jgi:hypothetical protein
VEFTGMRRGSRVEDHRRAALPLHVAMLSVGASPATADGKKHSQNS